jgi:hypothetical protein
MAIGVIGAALEIIRAAEFEVVLAIIMVGLPRDAFDCCAY